MDCYLFVTYIVTYLLPICYLALDEQGQTGQLKRKRSPSKAVQWATCMLRATAPKPPRHQGGRPFRTLPLHLACAGQCPRPAGAAPALSKTIKAEPAIYPALPKQSKRTSKLCVAVLFATAFDRPHKCWRLLPQPPLWMHPWISAAIQQNDWSRTAAFLRREMQQQTSGRTCPLFR